jgi:hypothetical protein
MAIAACRMRLMSYLHVQNSHAKQSFQILKQPRTWWSKAWQTRQPAHIPGSVHCLGGSRHHAERVAGRWTRKP